MLEVLIALLVLLIGIAGLLSLQITALHATAFSRHATEATVLAEDKLEALRTLPAADITNGNDGGTVNEQGIIDTDGLYTRDWTVDWSTGVGVLTVNVSWDEQGGEPYTITISTVRSP